MNIELKAPTQKSRPRFFVIAAAVLTFSGVAAFGFAPLAPDAALLPRQIITQTLALPANLEAQSEALADADYRFNSTERIQRGDTIASLLNRLGVDDAEAESFIRNNPQTKALYQLRPGRMLQARTDADGNLLWLRYLHTPVADGNNNGSQSVALDITRSGEQFTATQDTLTNERRVMMATGTIQSSLFGATDAAGIPDAIATQITDVFSGDIDFYHDLRRGDRFRLVYEMFYQDGEPTRAGRLLAIEFINSGEAHQAIWYQPEGQAGNYYSFDGQSLRRAFLRTPIEFSRVSSGFGGRMHPIMNTWRQHTGVDFAAPIGTPIRATADGVVSFVGKQNGYGNVVALKHQGVYSTLYGHMSGFAKGLRNGARVSQGQIIGYVGMTGWATGPHLHYEFRINNQAKDPMRVVMPQALPIPREELASFRSRSGELNRQMMLMRSIDGA